MGFFLSGLEFHFKCFIVGKNSKSKKGDNLVKIFKELPALITDVALLRVNIYSKFQVDIVNGRGDNTKCQCSSKTVVKNCTFCPYP